LIYVGIDDTDSLEGGCTTYLASQVIDELSDLSLIGEPRLVRLNPNVPWKTRGNGAIALTFKNNISITDQEILDRILQIVNSESHSSSQPGVIVSRKKLPMKLYWKGVRTILSKEKIMKYIKETSFKGLRGGRGLIGAACAIAWDFTKSNTTYELLAYRKKNKWGTVRDISKSQVNIVSKFDGVFSCMDDDGKISMVPHSPCPVLWGLRGTKSNSLLEGLSHLGPEKAEKSLLFLTNQGSDDHLQEKPLSKLEDGICIKVRGKVHSTPYSIKGGHRFFDLIDNNNLTITCAAYEPSGDFRTKVDKLIQGDIIIVCGSLSRSTLNLEKFKVVRFENRYVKPPNPLCNKCQTRMHSTGKNSDYKCRICSTKLPKPAHKSVLPDLDTCWYEPPSSARRHLSKPAALMD
tara:strand:+ start:452 stop:1666 length:1215 start_codon:yes stop_codon:yes gene_type:complete